MFITNFDFWVVFFPSRKAGLVLKINKQKAGNVCLFLSNGTQLGNGLPWWFQLIYADDHRDNNDCHVSRKKIQNNHVASVLPLKDLLLCKFLHAVINTLGLAFTRLLLQATRCHSPDNYFRKPCTTECDWQMQHCCNCLKRTARERERATRRAREARCEFGIVKWKQN